MRSVIYIFHAKRAKRTTRKIRDKKIKIVLEWVFLKPKHNLKYVRTCKASKKVELPGVEPGSKQAAELVSTCLVFH